MAKKLFKTRQAETEFYDNLDLAEYIKDLTEIKTDDSNVIPTSKSISLRLPVKLIQQVKLKANQMDVPYQSLIKVYIQKGINS